MLVVLLVFAALNWLTPLVTDDYCYKMMIVNGAVDTSHEVHTIRDLIVSQIDHFLYHNGRTPVELTYQLVDALLGKWFYNLLNPLFFCAYVFLIARYAVRRISLPWVVLTVSMLLFLMPVFQEYYLWMAGGFNYLWSSVLMLYYIMAIEKHEYRAMKRSSWGWMILGFFTGWMHEGLSIPLSVGLLVASVPSIRKNWHRIRVSEGFWMKIFFFAGALFCLSSTLQQGQSGGLNDWQRILAYKIWVGTTEADQLRFVYILFVMLVVAAMAKGYRIRNFLSANVALVVAIVISLGALFYTGVLTNCRASYAAELCSLIMILRLIDSWTWTRLWRESGTRCLMAASAVFAAIVLGYSVINYREHLDIVRQIQEGDQMILLDSRKIPPIVERAVCRTTNTYTCHADMFDPDGNIPRVIAAYYHTEPIWFCPMELYEELTLRPDHFDRLNDCGGMPYYVCKMNDDKEVLTVIFERKTTDMQFVGYKKGFFAFLGQLLSHESIPVESSWVNIDGGYYVFIRKADGIDLRKMIPRFFVNEDM